MQTAPSGVTVVGECGSKPAITVGDGQPPALLEVSGGIAGWTQGITGARAG